MTPARKALVLLPIVSVIGLSGLSPAARAASWQVDSRWRTGLELEDVDGASVRSTASLGGNLGLARSTETASTRLDAALTLRGDDGVAQRRSDGRLGLVQSITRDRDSFSAESSLASDSTVDAPLGSADVLLGRGDRRARNLELAWTHRYTERLSSRIGASLESTRYAPTLERAVDFDERSLSGTLSYALSEVTQASVTLSRSSYRAADGGSDSVSDSLRLGWSRQWDETASVSFSVGAFRSTRTLAFDTLVCPVDVRFCQAGLVSYITVRRSLDFMSSGSSYALTFDDRLDERSSLSVRASRDLQTGGAGVQRSDVLNLSLARTFTPQFSGSLVLAMNRSAAVAGGGEALSARSATLSLTRALSPNSSLNFGADLRRLAATREGAPATTTTRLSVSYESAGPGLNR